jgi:hypothetical protein
MSGLHFANGFFNPPPPPLHHVNRVSLCLSSKAKLEWYILPSVSFQVGVGDHYVQ